MQLGSAEYMCIESDLANNDLLYKSNFSFMTIKLMLLKWFTFWGFPAPKKGLFSKIFEKRKISSTNAT